MADPPTDADSTDLIDAVLAGTPDRVLGVVVGPAAAPEIQAIREVFAARALQLAPIAPSAGLRARIDEALAARPQRRAQRAVIVLDMIEDYLTPGRPLFVPRARAIVSAVQHRIAQARRDGDPVLYLCDYHEPGDPELETWPVHALAGTTGGSVVAALAPEPGEVVMHHRTYSAFFNTDLEGTLRRQGTNTIVLAGCATEVGLMATATDALMRGFAVVVPPECQAGTSAVAEQVTLGVLAVMRPVEPIPAPQTHQP